MGTRFEDQPVVTPIHPTTHDMDNPSTPMVSSIENTTGASKRDTHDVKICRVCREEEEEEVGDGPTASRLYSPCKCSGSIQYVHEECLVLWLKQTGKRRCELCKYPIAFTHLYAANTPAELPPRLVLKGLSLLAWRIIWRILRASTSLAALWCLLPYCVGLLWRLHVGTTVLPAGWHHTRPWLMTILDGVILIWCHLFSLVLTLTTQGDILQETHLLQEVPLAQQRLQIGDFPMVPDEQHQGYLLYDLWLALRLWLGLYRYTPPRLKTRTDQGRPSPPHRYRPLARYAHEVAHDCVISVTVAIDCFLRTVPLLPIRQPEGFPPPPPANISPGNAPRPPQDSFDRFIADHVHSVRTSSLPEVLPQALLGFFFSPLTGSLLAIIETILSSLVAFEKFLLLRILAPWCFGRLVTLLFNRILPAVVCARFTPLWAASPLLCALFTVGIGHALIVLALNLALRFYVLYCGSRGFTLFVLRGSAQRDAVFHEFSCLYMRAREVSCLLFIQLPSLPFSMPYLPYSLYLQYMQRKLLLLRTYTYVVYPLLLGLLLDLFTLPLFHVSLSTRWQAFQRAPLPWLLVRWPMGMGYLLYLSSWAYLLKGTFRPGLALFNIPFHDRYYQPSRMMVRTPLLHYVYYHARKFRQVVCLLACTITLPYWLTQSVLTLLMPACGMRALAAVALPLKQQSQRLYLPPDLHGDLLFFHLLACFLMFDTEGMQVIRSYTNGLLRPVAHALHLSSYLYNEVTFLEGEWRGDRRILHQCIAEVLRLIHWREMDRIRLQVILRYIPPSVVDYYGLDFYYEPPQFHARLALFGAYCVMLVALLYAGIVVMPALVGRWLLYWIHVAMKKHGQSALTWADAHVLVAWPLYLLKDMASFSIGMDVFVVSFLLVQSAFRRRRVREETPAVPTSVAEQPTVSLAADSDVDERDVVRVSNMNERATVENAIQQDINSSSPSDTEELVVEPLVREDDSREGRPPSQDDMVRELRSVRDPLLYAEVARYLMLRAAAEEALETAAEQVMRERVWGEGEEESESESESETESDTDEEEFEFEEINDDTWETQRWRETMAATAAMATETRSPTTAPTRTPTRLPPLITESDTIHTTPVTRSTERRGIAINVDRRDPSARQNERDTLIGAWWKSRSWAEFVENSRLLWKVAVLSALMEGVVPVLLGLVSLAVYDFALTGRFRAYFQLSREGAAAAETWSALLKAAWWRGAVWKQALMMLRRRLGWHGLPVWRLQRGDEAFIDLQKGRAWRMVKVLVTMLLGPPWAVTCVLSRSARWRAMVILSLWGRRLLLVRSLYAVSLGIMGVWVSMRMVTLIYGRLESLARYELFFVGRRLRNLERVPRA